MDLSLIVAQQRYFHPRPSIPSFKGESGQLGQPYDLEFFINTFAAFLACLALTDELFI